MQYPRCLFEKLFHADDWKNEKPSISRALCEEIEVRLKEIIGIRLTFISKQ